MLKGEGEWLVPQELGLVQLWPTHWPSCILVELSAWDDERGKMGESIRSLLEESVSQRLQVSHPGVVQNGSRVPGHTSAGA